ncbi:MAG: hypothetical protein JST55_05045 [Bacteroidetes bacterium]|nr:hypothetical protein [Bacteroidota bacterium]
MPESESKSPNSFQSGNLIQLLKSFSKEEMREFGKFVNSPFHNNRSEVILFFDEVMKFYPGFNQSELSKENIYYSLYLNKKYKDDVMRRLSSNLFKLAEEFCAYNNFRKDTWSYEKNLLESYSARNIDKLFWKQHSKTETYLEEQTLRDSEYYSKLSVINEIEMKYILKDDPTYKKSGYEKEMNNLWKYTLSALLRLHGFAEYEKYFFNKKYEIKFEKELLKIAEESGYMNSAAIEIYYLILKLYGEDKNDEVFFRLMNLIEENFFKFEKSECFSFYVHLINYCNINKLANDKEYIRIKFEIVKKMVERDLVVQNGVIDPGWFRGIFSMAFNAGEIKFAEDFIEKHKELVTGRDKENIVKHVYANLAIYKKDYNSALEYLSTSSYQHLNDKWTVKQMYLTIYYEMNDFEQFSYTADSIKHLIKDEGSWNENLIVPIRNFINILTKLFRIKINEKKIPLDEIRKEVMDSKIISRKWLLEKIDELESR